jgi:hypothetical protein
MSISVFDRFLNMGSINFTTDDVVPIAPRLFANLSDSRLANNATPLNLSGCIVLRDGSGMIFTGTINATRAGVNGSSRQYIRQNIGAVINNATFTLPSGNWGGHIWLNYGNGSGRIALRKYGFRKNAGGTGFFTDSGTDLYHFVVGITDSSISFNASTGVFTFNLVSSFGFVAANAFIELFQV